MRLHDYLDYWGRETPDAELAVQAGRTLSYREGVESANRLAHALIDAGLVSGSRIAVLARNSIEYLLLYFAASKAGVTVVPLNARLGVDDWTGQVRDAGAEVLFASAAFTPSIDRVRELVPGVRRFVAMNGSPAADWEVLTDWLARFSPTQPRREVDDDAVVYQMYTSGTTGESKGVLITHRALTANLAQIAPALRLAPGERGLAVSPMSHAIVVLNTFSVVSAGATVFIQPDFDPARVVALLDEARITVAFVVPAILQVFSTAVSDVAQRGYAHLRLMQYGASPITESTLRGAMTAFKCDFLQTYGLTEASVALTFLSPNDHRRALAGESRLFLAAGRPALGTEIQIVDELDRPLPPGQVGEIVARGPQVMRGYWNRPDETEWTLRGGWLHTGDAGTLDAQGYLYVRDRIKDLIVSGGEKISARAVEDVLTRHPLVAEAAVIGVPDALRGEVVKAIVVLRDGATLTTGELLRHCRAVLGNLRSPRSIEFAPTLPRTPSGKILKRALRDPYWVGQSGHTVEV